jgi:hypothetical protein
MPNAESPDTIIAYVKYAHGLYNGIVILLFVCQGWLGLRIRRGRIDGNPPEVMYVRRHRKFGPALAVLGIFGFLGGVGAVSLAEGRIFEHPLHFLTGLTICALIITTVVVSRKIRGRETGIRTVHYLIGMIILSLYCIQAYLGIQMIF